MGVQNITTPKGDRRVEGVALALMFLCAGAGVGLQFLSAALAGVSVAGLAAYFLLAALPAGAAYAQLRVFRIASDLAREEETLKRRVGGESIFSTIASVAPEERLARTARTLAAVLDVVMLVAAALVAWRLFRYSAPAAGAPLVVAIPFLGLTAAAAYVGGRYLGALAERDSWAPLGPAAAWIAAGGLLALVVGATFAASHALWTGALGVLDRLAPAWFALLALEKAAALLGRAYGLGRREPGPGRSRLVELVSAPAVACAHARDAIAYNFGITLSGASLRRAVFSGALPFVLAAVGVFIAASCVVWVEPGRAALLERWGVRRGEALAPGLHFKAPWPIDRALIVDVRTVRVERVGHDAEHEHAHDEGAALWSKAHGKEPYFLTPAWGDREDAKGLIAIVASVSFSVADASRYAYAAARPDEVMEFLFRREIMHLAASTDPRAFFAPECASLRQTLAREIEARAQRYGLQVHAVALEHVHMPVEVGEAFEEVTHRRAVAEAAVASADAERIRLERAAPYEVDVLAAGAQAEAWRLGARGATAAFAARALAPSWKTLGAVLRPRMLFESLGRAVRARPKVILPETPGGTTILEVDAGARFPLRVLSGEE